MIIHSSCEIEDFVETHLCKLCVILRSRVHISPAADRRFAWFLFQPGRDPAPGARAGAADLPAPAARVPCLAPTSGYPQGAALSVSTAYMTCARHRRRAFA